MKINWTPRLKSAKFWVSMVPLVLLLAQQVAAIFGYKIEIDGLNNQLTSIITTVFAILAGIGIVTDPTTPGLSDSRQAMSYGSLVQSESSKENEQLRQRLAKIETLSDAKSLDAETKTADVQPQTTQPTVVQAQDATQVATTPTEAGGQDELHKA